ncbi:hypothetical protein SAMN04515671_3601 [Nakamurella panacisegetis]|uniref:Uncharacterized protein n=1 Tax=Nakamurella panacisegetis TaxID=1090615 RepID=A0A1H0RIZ6_9ACTN|nr:hypothetical protein [Nakamurella panacisegetis]SDP29494.1 hypothetical protein SAMN04515671_3601 [Nakamurella panacisegetis]
MPLPTSLDVLLHLEAADGTIKGTLQEGSGYRWPFYGWLELSSILDNLRAAHSGAVTAPVDPASDGG